jgi:hypothetical protein
MLANFPSWRRAIPSRWDITPHPSGSARERFRISRSPSLRRKLGPEPEDEEDDPLEIREGDKGYTAIIEHSPGAECCGEDAIARDLTRTAEKPA